MVLLAGCVGARPVVLAPLALRATGTLNAGRGAKARRARRRVRRLRLADLYCSGFSLRPWSAFPRRSPTSALGAPPLQGSRGRQSG